MPHGESWITLFLQKYLPGFYAWMLDCARVLSLPFSDDGLSWIEHQPIKIQHVLGAVLVFIIVTILAVLSHARLRDTKTAIIPEDKPSASAFVEMFASTVYNMMSNIMGKKAARFFLPLIGTCAFFIFFSNALGLIPGFLPPTDNLNTTLSCAIIIFIATHVFGIKEHGPSYLKHFIGPTFKVKWYLLPATLTLNALMLVIEVISHIVRPVSLSIRLFVNIFADHLILGIFLMFFGSWLFFWIPGPAAIMMLGVVVVLVQTLVFCLLSTIYISMAIAHDGH